MKTSNKITGNIGENLATEYLKNLGYEVVERNWHYSRFGEIDIICLDKETLVFVEVKTRKTVSFGHPFEAIDAKKIQQIRSIAQGFIQNTTLKYKNCRIDGISVLLSNPAKIEHLKNIF